MKGATLTTDKKHYNESLMLSLRRFVVRFQLF